MKDKIYGCWAGKCLGGVAGIPYEGVPEPPLLTREKIVLNNVPNDDLELQLVWMAGLKAHGLSLREKEFADIWRKHIPHGFDEYCVAIRNLRRGILPPASGWKDNFFSGGMGAAIRSEIWALIFAERPDAAAFFAAQDAQVDHWGDGVWGEVFLAVAEALACLTGDLEKSLRDALAYLPAASRVRQWQERVFQKYDRGVSFAAIRNDLLLHIQRQDNFTDCAMNLTFITAALLWGRGNFEKTILNAVNFGRDTDCTGASCGAFLGITYGKKALPSSWLRYLEEKLALSDYVQAIPDTPRTFTELVTQTESLRNSLLPRLPKRKYPSYTPYAPHAPLPSKDASRWLILKNFGDTAPLEKAIRENGGVPAAMASRLQDFPDLILDLSPYAGDACTLDLFTELEITPENTTPPEEIVLCVAADVGLTFWLDGRRLLNHHSRRKMIPAFHRTEGGASFACPMHTGEKHLLHLRLYNCMPPLKACVMFGNLFNDHLDGFSCHLKTVR